MAYVIGDDCIACGTCQGECPVEAISEGEKYSIDPDSAVLALAYVPLRLSVWVNQSAVAKRKEVLSSRAAPLLFSANF